MMEWVGLWRGNTFTVFLNKGYSAKKNKVFHIFEANLCKCKEEDKKWMKVSFLFLNNEVGDHFYSYVIHGKFAKKKKVFHMPRGKLV